MNFKNHVLNEQNQLITADFIESILSKYNCNHKVKNLQLFQLAMVHISYLEKTSYAEKTVKILQETEPISDNIDLSTVVPLQQECYGRLEFYGDAVIKYTLAKYLYNRYDEPEGFLSSLRSKIEKEETLSALSIHLGLQTRAIIARNIEQVNGRMTNVKLSEDIFEAFIGALDIDSDIHECEKFIISVVENCLDLSKMINIDDNYKGILSHYYQKQKWGDVQYNCITNYTENQQKSSFKITINVPNTKIIGHGEDKIKGTAHALAAKDVLEQLGVIDNDNNDDNNDFYGEI